MVLDLDFGKTGAEERCRNHRADERRTVAADDHCDRDRQCVDAERLTDGDHDRQHAVEVAVGIERERQRHGQDADDQRQMLPERLRQDRRDDVRQAAYHGRDRVGREFHRLCGDRLAVRADAGGQHTHQDRRAHQRGAHHERRTGVQVDDLLMHLGVEAVVDEQRQRAADHERNVAGERVPDQHGDDRKRQEDVYDEQLRTCKLVVRLLMQRFLEIDLTLGLGKLAVETCAAALLKETGEDCVRERQHDAEDLNRQDRLPERAGFHAHNGRRAHGRTCPRHQVQNAHRKDCDAQERGQTHMHALIDRQHGGDDDAERRCAAAVEVPDERDDRGHDAHADDVVADELHQLADDDVKHARVGHDAEIQDGKDEQRGGRSGARETGFDHGRNVVEGITTEKDQNDHKDRGEDDKRERRLHLALEQHEDDRGNGQQPQNADEDVALHELPHGHEAVADREVGTCREDAAHDEDESHEGNGHDNAPNQTDQAENIARFGAAGERAAIFCEFLALSSADCTEYDAEQNGEDKAQNAKQQSLRLLRSAVCLSVLLLLCVAH